VKYTFASLVLLALAGCTGPKVTLDEKYVSEAFVFDRWLSLVSRDANEDSIVQRLGEPTETFIDGRVFVYDLIMTDDDASARKYFRYYGSRPGLELPPVKLPLYLYGSGDEIPAVHNERRKLLASKDDSLVVVRPGYENNHHWQTVGREAEYSLVLVFDDSRILQSFRLLRIKP